VGNKGLKTKKNATGWKLIKLEIFDKFDQHTKFTNGLGLQP
jgi:hypothetical protein